LKNKPSSPITSTGPQTYALNSKNFPNQVNISVIDDRFSE
jgi:hypothetical protein